MSDGTFFYPSDLQRPTPTVGDPLSEQSAIAYAAALKFNATANVNAAEGLCPLPTPLYPVYTVPLAGGTYDFYWLNVIISSACVGFAGVSIIILMLRHWMNFTKPQEQAYILRICAFIPLYGFGTVMMIAYPNTYAYLYGWMKVLEGITISYFFIMMSWFLVPNSNDMAPRKSDMDEVYMASQTHGNAQKNWPITKNMSRYRRHLFVVFQCPITNFFCAVFSDITQHTGNYCITSKDRDDAHLWIEIIQIVSVVTAVIGVIKEYKRNAKELQSHKVLAKLFAFKLIIGIQVLQNIIYMILEALDDTPLKPSLTMSPVDLLVGIPNMIICLVMVPFSIYFHFAYTVAPYKKSKDPEALRTGDRQVRLKGLKVLRPLLSQSQYFGMYPFMLRAGSVAKNMERGGRQQNYGYQMNQGQQAGYQQGGYSQQGGYPQQGGYAQQGGYPQQGGYQGNQYQHFKAESSDSSPVIGAPRY